MKNIIKIGVVAVSAFAAVTFTSCSNFLDVTPTDKVTPDFVFKNYKTACSVLGGIYDRMTCNDGFGDGKATGIHNFLVASDLQGTDLIYRGFSSDQFQGNDYSFTSRLFDHSRPDFFWKYCYMNIYASNEVIANVSKMSGTSEEKKQVEGEARFIRGYNYWLLVQWFQHTYLKDPKAPGVPLYLGPTAIPQQRAPLDEVYAAIVADLKWCIDNMPAARRSGSKFIPNPDVASGVLARAYMDMGKYEEALPLAKGLEEKFPLMSTEEYKSGFANVSVGECIWGLPTSSRNSGYNYTMPSIYSHPRLYGRWSQKRIYINDTFYNLFTSTDIRKSLIIPNPNTNEAANDYSLTLVTNKIMDETPAAKGPNTILMRGAEMLLVEVECLARTGKEAEAQELLHKLQVKRDPSAVKSTATGGALLDEILVERRKELFGEGFSFIDYKRFRKPIVRTGNHYGDAMVNIPADDKQFVFQIPRAEMQVNPMDQND